MAKWYAAFPFLSKCKTFTSKFTNALRTFPPLAVSVYFFPFSSRERTPSSPSPFTNCSPVICLLPSLSPLSLLSLLLLLLLFQFSSANFCLCQWGGLARPQLLYPTDWRALRCRFTVHGSHAGATAHLEWSKLTQKRGPALAGASGAERGAERQPSCLPFPPPRVHFLM